MRDANAKIHVINKNENPGSLSVHMCVLAREDLSVCDKLTYVVLDSLASPARRICALPVKDIAEMASSNVKQVKKSLRVLENMGYITTSTLPDELKFYTLNNPHGTEA